MLLLKNILSIPITILGYLFFLIFNFTPNIIYQSYVRSYCYTNGKIINIFNKIDYFLKKKNFFKSKINNKLNFYEIDKELKKNGYFIFPNKLNNSIIKDLTNLANKNNCYYFDDSNIKKTCNFLKLKNKKYQSSKYSYNKSLLIKSKVIRKIILDNNNLLIANNYFGNMPYFSNIDMWWATKRKKKNTIKTEIANQSAQFFHFDLDRPKWLKLFIYLTDVDEFSGPHEYIEGTHNILSKPSKLLERGYARIKMDEIKKFYKKKKIKMIKGIKGTMFIADTSCFHRGIPPLNKNRLILVIEYSNNLFGAKKIMLSKNEKNKLDNQNIRVE